MRALVLLSLVTGIALAQSDLSVALDQITSSEAVKQKIPGISAAVVKDDRTVWTSGWGVASVESKIAITPDTLFRLGSSRVFLAAAISELSSQGRLQLGTPAGDYLFGLEDRQARLSAQKLLSSASEAGDEAVAARLVENVRARPASAVLDEMIFAPAGMMHTTFAPGIAMTYPLALGHTSDGKVNRSPQAWEGSGLFTSASDMARFLTVFLNEGKIGDKLNERQVFPATVVALSSDSGYGLDADASRGVRLVRQTSAAPGYAAAILMAPDFHTGVVVLANRDGANAMIVAQKLLERSLPVRFPESLAMVR